MWSALYKIKMATTCLGHTLKACSQQHQHQHWKSWVSHDHSGAVIIPYHWLQEFTVEVGSEKTKYTFQLTEITPAENPNTKLNKYHLSIFLLQQLMLFGLYLYGLKGSWNFRNKLLIYIIFIIGRKSNFSFDRSPSPVFFLYPVQKLTIWEWTLGVLFCNVCHQ